MPVRLKSFELHGYKTFASRIEFQFSDGITAIVGPNGSGKSNIADALRWVLGEQSFGLLRAKKTEDMIFSGSENRSRAGMASATILFDNSNGWLPIDFVEVGITRRAYRDGENEYLINGQRVRLKDVSEILAKSGLAERTYTIIGQGVVDAALALRAEERRSLFEEAAGIGLHRSRREEAIKRLETTHRNLERVQDILTELQPRLRSLERQVKRAQEYDQMQQNLKMVLRDWYGYHWHKTQAELVEAQAYASTQETELSQAQSSQHELDLKLNDYRQKIISLRDKLNDLHKELTSLHQRRESISREQAINGERLRLLILQLDQENEARIKREEDVGLQKDRLENSKLELTQLENELTEAQQGLAESIENLNLRLKERSLIEEDIRSCEHEISRLSTQLTQWLVLVKEKGNQVNRFREGIQKAERVISAKELELDEIQRTEKSTLIEKEERSKALKTLELELKEIKEKLSDYDFERNSIIESLSKQRTAIAQITAELIVLEEAEKNLIGYNEGARILLQAMNDMKIDGAIGTLGSSIEIPEEYETAIAAVMGEFIDSLIIKSIDQSGPALDLIDSEKTRGSIFPLDTIRAQKIQLNDIPYQSESVIGIASQLISTNDVLRPIVDYLFGKVVLVKDRKTARAIIASNQFHGVDSIRVVTLKGEMYLIGGPIVTGASGKNILARPRQKIGLKNKLDQANLSLRELEEKYEALEVNVSDLKKHEQDSNERFQVALNFENAISTKISKIELQVDKIKHDLQWNVDQKVKYEADLNHDFDEITNLKLNINQLSEELSKLKVNFENKKNELNLLPIEEFQNQNSFWKTNVAVIEQAIVDARKRHQEINNRIREAEVGLEEIVAHSSRLDDDIKILRENIASCSEDEINIAGKIEEYSIIVDPYESQLNVLERDHAGLLSNDSETRQLLRVAEQKYTQAKINLAHHQEAFESIRRHIEDDFGLVSFDYSESVSGPKPLPIDGMVEELPKIEILPPDIEESIRQQKAQIRKLGAINLEAQAEYEEVKGRFEFITNQVEDLSKAEIDIKEVISELDLLMEREFKRTFEAVAQEFKQIFTRLFGGGSARLTLTDPNNITDTGIEIEARLPGRREQGLSLLSGGERSLTAVALIFALLRISPTPFCILDEVDAMLDEANVTRFRELLTELCEKTQFIVITHNRNTVQAASIIYGVTMGRDSASQVISLKMDELGEEFGV